MESDKTSSVMLINAFFITKTFLIKPFFNNYLSFFDMQRKCLFLNCARKTRKIYRKTIFFY